MTKCYRNPMRFSSVHRKVNATFGVEISGDVQHPASCKHHR